MNLPEDQHPRRSGNAADVVAMSWVRVCATIELLPGETKVAWDGATPIFVVNLDGEIYAMEDRCTHEDFELSAGPLDIDSGQIECLLHGARFDLRSGEALCAPAYLALVKFPVKLEDDAVWTRDDRT